MTGLDSVCPDWTDWFSQMFIACLPMESWELIREHMWPEFKIEIPVLTWNDQTFIRVFVQAYNTPKHMERLLGAIESICNI